ncbi:hypothetical protein [Dyella sp. 2HG41-7]|uniref:hypothetical protein n=1 Tax=Dyella sp. 2HG41-7 TaxID=2883239 RepID=UPI001F216ABE|nr:hypothetical protein [Dyella sp. 2HG41-7]
MKDQDTLTPDQLEMERLTRQMKALIRAKWPERYNTKRADLKIVPSVPVTSPANAKMSREEIRGQLLAHIRKTWPEEFALGQPELKVMVPTIEHETPSPRIDREMVDRLKAMIRSTWPDEFGRGSQVIPFPRKKKPGAKSRKGPCAEVIRFRCGRADYSDRQRKIFDIFVKDGKSARFSAAMIEFMRRPCSRPGDDLFVRGGIAIADYMDQLARDGI